VFQKATLTLPDRDGRTVQIFGNEMDVTPGQAGAIASARVTNNVKLTTSDGLTVTANEATYDGKTTVLTVPGDVKFVKERLTGTGVGATYDQTRNVLWLLDRARIVVTPDENGAGALDASATSAGLARADHYIRLNGNAHVIGEGRELRAQELTVQLSPDDRLIQHMSLRGQSSLTGAPGAAAAPAMSANDIDLTYGADGRAIEHARLMENAVAQLAGAEGGKRIAGRTIEMTMAPEGGTVTALTATEKVQVDLPAAEGIPARRITAATLTSGGPNGLQTATFTGGVDYREIRPGARGAAPSERTGRSLQLVVETEPGLGAIQLADFRGNVRIVDGATTAEGQRAIYRVAADTFDIAPSPGDPGPPPTVNDGRVLVNARTIAFTAANRKLLADTDVRSSLQPANKAAAKPAAGGRGKPAPAPAQEGGKVPAILKQDQPVIVTSNRLEYDGAAGTANYTGNAKLFQDRTSIYGDAILIDDRTANLTATGHVRSVMFFQETDAKTRKPQLVQTDAAGHMLVYEDAKRLATYTTGPTARAHIVGTQGDVTAEQIQLFLKEGGNELERAEADKNVTVKEGFRTSTGQHLTYTPADETYVMRGTPVEVVEKTPTDCRIALGTVLRFLRTSVDMRIDGNGIAPVTMTPCPPGKAPSL
jgi:lipopolysaccharide export system protein LptA